MVNLFHKYQKPIMIAVTLLMIIAFVILYNARSFAPTPMREAGEYEIYGKKVSQQEIDRGIRRFQVAQYLGLNNLLGGLIGQAFSENEAVSNFVWNSYVLDRQAKALGIEPTLQEKAEFVAQLPVFQTNNQFDPNKYAMLRQDVLFPNGFTDAQIDELVRDELRVRKLMKLIGSTVDISPAEFEKLYTRNYQKTEVSLIRFPLAKFMEAVNPTEEEISAYFESHKEQLKTEEKRVVSFVEVALTEDEKKLEGKDRADAFKKKADLTREFGQALVATDTVNFADAAKKFGLEVKTTEEFPLSNLPKEFAGNAEAAVAIEKLSEQLRFSDPVTTETGFVVFHLDKIIPSRPLTLEEAKPRIVEAIKREKGEAALVAHAKEVREKILKAMEAGKPFTAAAEEAGVKAEKFPPFSLAEPVNAPGAARIAEASIGLKENGLSNLVTTPDEGFLIHLDRLLPVDAAKMAEEQKQQLEELRQQYRILAFMEWLNGQREQSGLRVVSPAHSHSHSHPESEG